MKQLMFLKVQLMLTRRVNEECQEMKQLEIMKMQLMLNVPFLPGVPNTAATPTIQSEWLDNRKTLIIRQSPLIIFWEYTIHKSQGKTLYLAIIDFSKIEKWYGMTLVALYRERKLIHLILRLIFLE